MTRLHLCALLALGEVADDPLFQDSPPTTFTWNSPTGLPWVCLQVVPISSTLKQVRPLWVWFQFRSASSETMLHPSTIQALSYPDSLQIISLSPNGKDVFTAGWITIHIPGTKLPVIDIRSGNRDHPHPGGLSGNLNNNMLGTDVMAPALDLSKAQIKRRNKRIRESAD